MQSALLRLERGAANPSVSLIPVPIGLVQSGASMGETVVRLRKMWGLYG
jgi:hypothetical protein